MHKFFRHASDMTHVYVSEVARRTCCPPGRERRCEVLELVGQGVLHVLDEQHDPLHVRESDHVRERDKSAWRGVRVE